MSQKYGLTDEDDPTYYPSGIDFVQSSLGLWSGSKWVRRYADAKFYPPCTTEAQDECDRISKSGVSSWVLYLPPGRYSFCSQSKAPASRAGRKRSL